MLGMHFREKLIFSYYFAFLTYMKQDADRIVKNPSSYGGGGGQKRDELQSLEKNKF